MTSLPNDCIQIHLFELPKHTILDNNEPITDPIEQWLYFFTRASRCTAEELVHRLADPVFIEATGVLEMIAKTPEERQVYEDRLKAQRDAWAQKAQAQKDGLTEGLKKGLKLGIQQGLEQGLEQGKLIGQANLISVLQSLTGDPVQSVDELIPLGDKALDEIEASLKLRLSERN